MHVYGDAALPVYRAFQYVKVYLCSADVQGQHSGKGYGLGIHYVHNAVYKLYEVLCVHIGLCVYAYRSFALVDVKGCSVFLQAQRHMAVAKADVCISEVHIQSQQAAERLYVNGERAGAGLAVPVCNAEDIKELSVHEDFSDDAAGIHVVHEG